MAILRLHLLAWKQIGDVSSLIIPRCSCSLLITHWLYSIPLCLDYTYIYMGVGQNLWTYHMTGWTTIHEPAILGYLGTRVLTHNHIGDRSNHLSQYFDELDSQDVCFHHLLERTPKIPSGFTDIAMDNGQPIYRWLTYQNWWRSIATVSHYKRVSTCSTFEVDIRPLCWTFHAVLLWRPILQAVAAFVFGAYKRLQPPHTNIVNTASHTSHRPRSLA